MNQEIQKDGTINIEEVTILITIRLKSLVEKGNLEYYNAKKDAILEIKERKIDNILGTHLHLQLDLLTKICDMHDYFTKLVE